MWNCFARIIICVECDEIFHGGKQQDIEEINVVECKTDLAFIVFVTRHLNRLNKEPHSKYKHITEMYHNTKAFKDKLPLWENERKLHNLVHFPSLKPLDAIYPQRIQQYSQSILLLREEYEER
jgi:hypothetical protein